MAAPVQLVVQFANLVPAATLQAAPAVFPMKLPTMDVVWIEWRVPPGPRGDVGWWIGSHGQSMIPFNLGSTQWIVTDDESAHWDLTEQMDSGDWQMAAYNIGVRPHTVTVRFGLAPLPDMGSAIPLVLPSSILSGQSAGA